MRLPCAILTIVENKIGLFYRFCHLMTLLIDRKLNDFPDLKASDLNNNNIADSPLTLLLVCDTKSNCRMRWLTNHAQFFECHLNPS